MKGERTQPNQSWFPAQIIIITQDSLRFRSAESESRFAPMWYSRNPMPPLEFPVQTLPRIESPVGDT